MAKIKIMALGGLGENGKNMFVVEVDNQIFILDGGMRYPDIDMYGIDGVIPNIDYLKQNNTKIKGIFLSHGHEDNIGAIPYLLNNLHIKVFGSHFTISLLESQLLANHMNVDKYKLFRVNDSKVLNFNNVTVSFFNTTHSIPESLGISIETCDGVIVYCTDFNFGQPNDIRYQTNYQRIIDTSKKRVLCLLSESLNSGAIGRVNNDSLLEHNFNYELNHTPSRIIVGAYSTDLLRIQKVVDLAVKENRYIAILARNSASLIDVAVKSGYLRIPEELYISINRSDFKEFVAKEKNILIVVTGNRYDPYASLVKMTCSSEEIIHITPSDKVVIMCPPIPGTERHATESLNTLSLHNINVSTFDKDVLRSSHASKEDLRMLYQMLKPDYIIPIKGEYRHMYDQYLLALDSNYDKEHILLLDNGEVIIFDNGELLKEREEVKTGDIFVDGTSFGVIDDAVMIERTCLAEEGVVFIYCVINESSKTLVSKVNLKTRGFSSSFSDVELTNAFGGLLDRIIMNSLSKKKIDCKGINIAVCEELRKNIFRFTKHRPIIIPVISKIK